MKQLFVLTLAFVLTGLSLTSCGKKTDTAGGTDSTAKSDSGKSVSSSAPAVANAAKYPVKSGIIHGESEAMGMKITTTKYFDNFGALEAEETKSTMKMAGITVNTHNMKIMKNGMLYDIDLEKKEGKQMAMAIPAGVGGMDFKNMGEQMMKDMGVKQLANESVAGKDCKVYEMTGSGNGKGMTGKIWLWGGTPLKTDMSMSGMKVSQTTTSVEENVSVPASTFEVPKDVAMKEIDMKTGASKDIPKQ